MTPNKAPVEARPHVAAPRSPDCAPISPFLALWIAPPVTLLLALISPLLAPCALCLALPACQRSFIRGNDQASISQVLKRPSHLTLAGMRSHTRMNLTAGQAFLLGVQQCEQHLPSLGRADRLAAPQRHELAVPEAHGDGSALVLDLREGNASVVCEFCHLQRSAAPDFDDPAPVERLGDQRVPGSRLVGLEQLLRR